MDILLISLLLLIVSSISNDKIDSGWVIDKGISKQAKGLAILMVIISHLNSIYLQWEVFKPFGAIGVAIFLFLSGYGLFKSFESKGLENFFKKRISTVMYPYIFVTVIWIFIDYLIGKIYGLETILLSILGVNFKPNIDPTMWYVTFIMFWYVLFYMVFKYTKGNITKISLLFGFSLLFLIAWYFDVFNTASFHFAIHSFTFPSGILFGMYGDNFLLKYKNKFVSICLLLSVILICFGVAFFPRNGIYYMTLSFSGMTLILSLFIVFKEYKVLFFGYIGGYSYELYLVEGYLIDLIITRNQSTSKLYLVIYILFTIISTYMLKKLLGMYRTIILVN